MIQIRPKTMAETKPWPKPPQPYVSAGLPVGGRNRSIAAKIGRSGKMLRNWLRQAERDWGVRAGPARDERERIKALERENCVLG